MSSTFVPLILNFLMACISFFLAKTAALLHLKTHLYFVGFGLLSVSLLLMPVSSLPLAFAASLPIWVIAALLAPKVVQRLGMHKN